MPLARAPRALSTQSGTLRRDDLPGAPALTIAPTWVEVNIAYEPYAGASDVFAKTQTTFTAQSLAKRTPAKEQARQSHFNGQLRRLAKAFGGADIPVFLSFQGVRVRMDKGCVGHAVAAGVLEVPQNNAAGFIDQVRLRVV